MSPTRIFTVTDLLESAEQHELAAYHTEGKERDIHHETMRAYNRAANLLMDYPLLPQPELARVVATLEKASTALDYSLVWVAHTGLNRMKLAAIESARHTHAG